MGEFTKGEFPGIKKEKEEQKPIAEAGLIDDNNRPKEDSVLETSGDNVEAEAHKKEQETQMAKENVDEIIKLPFGVMNRAQIVLILAGERPALEFDVKNFDAVQLHDAIKSIEKIGLFAELAPSISDPKINRIVISKNRHVIDELKNLSPDSDSDHRRYGQLMGFPETAIEAFSDETKQLDFEKQDPIYDNLPHFFKFRMSKDHWQEELKILVKWNKLILKYAPELFDELYPPEEAERFKRNLNGM